MGNQTTACAVSPNQLKSVPVWRGKHKNARVATQTLNLSGIVHLSAGSSEHKGAANMTSWPTVAFVCKPKFEQWEPRTACAVSPNQLRVVTVWQSILENARVATQTLNLSGIMHLSAGSSEHRCSMRSHFNADASIARLKIARKVDYDLDRHGILHLQWSSTRHPLYTFTDHAFAVIQNSYDCASSAIH